VTGARAGLLAPTYTAAQIEIALLRYPGMPRPQPGDMYLLFRYADAAGNGWVTQVFFTAELLRHGPATTFDRLAECFITPPPGRSGALALKRVIDLIADRQVW
jgi:hypothetical protein